VKAGTGGPIIGDPTGTAVGSIVGDVVGDPLGGVGLLVTGVDVGAVVGADYDERKRVVRIEKHRNDAQAENKFNMHRTYS
jgi:hypothetical protein